MWAVSTHHQSIPDYPEDADRFYAIAAGRLRVPVVYEGPHIIAFDDGSEGDVTRISVIPREPIPHIAAMDFSDAIRWLEVLTALRAIPREMGWGERDGFRIETAVHPPYQRAPWLCVHVMRDARKKVTKPADERGYTRDIGHFSETVSLRKRVEVFYANSEFMVFVNPHDPDNQHYEHALMGIPRRQVTTILDEEFTAQDWLSLVGGVRQATLRVGIPAYLTRINVRPPYQHTPWVHVHVLAGGKALPDRPPRA